MSSDPIYIDNKLFLGRVEEQKQFRAANLEAALKKNPGQDDWARRDPDFDFIRDDPRFAALVGIGG